MTSRRFRLFMALTVLGGAIFLGLQAREWTHLIGTEGLSIKTSLFSATFFILTGFHGCHVFGGVVLLSVVLLRGMAGQINLSGNTGWLRRSDFTGISSIWSGS